MEEVAPFVHARRRVDSFHQLPNFNYVSFTSAVMTSLQHHDNHGCKQTVPSKRGWPCETVKWQICSVCLCVCVCAMVTEETLAVLLVCQVSACGSCLLLSWGTSLNQAESCRADRWAFRLFHSFTLTLDRGDISRPASAGLAHATWNEYKYIQCIYFLKNKTKVEAGETPGSLSAPERSQASQWWDLVWMCRAWQNRFIFVTVGNNRSCSQAAVTHI